MTLVLAGTPVGEIPDVAPEFWALLGRKDMVPDMDGKLNFELGAVEALEQEAGQSLNGGEDGCYVPATR